MCGIYKITNLINGKIYIGQSKNIAKRWNAHHNEPYNYNSKSFESSLYRAIRKYGIDNFSFEILEECEVHQLDEKEIYYIDFYQSFVNGYNETLGGTQGAIYSKLTQEQVLEIKEKLSSQRYTLVGLSEYYNVHKDTIRNINNGWSWIEVGDYKKYPLYYSNKHKKYNEYKQKNFCLDCGKEISQGAIRCVYCSKQKQTKGQYPDKDTIYQDIKNLGFVGAGKKYGVSDNALRKYCLKIGLSKYKKDYI